MSDLHDFILKKFTGQPAWKKMRQGLRDGAPATINQMRGGALACMLEGLRRDRKRPLLAVLPIHQWAENLYDDLHFLRARPLLHLPEWDTLPYDQDEPVIQVIAKTWEVYERLVRLSEGGGGGDERPPLIVTSAPALAYRFPTLEQFAQASTTVEWGEELDVDALSEHLVGAGYEPYALVESRGEFSVRGGIIDIFPPSFEHPVRIDLFGDEVEALRFFDVQTQRAIKAKEPDERLLIPPARLRALRSKVLDEDGDLATFRKLLPETTDIIIVEPERCRAELDKFQDIIERNHADVSESTPADARSAIIAPERLFLGGDEVQSHINETAPINVHRLPIESGGGADTFTFHIGAFEDVKPQLEYYLEFLQQKWRGSWTCLIVCDNDGQVHRLAELLEEKGLDTHTVLAGEPQELPESFTDFTRIQPIILCTGDLHNGFTAPDCGLAVLTDREIFGRYKRAHVYRKHRKGKAISGLDELKRGDYVVHVEHGIGRFLGLRRQEIDGLKFDLIEILYADNNKLLVPTQNIQYVQKYAAIEGVEPSLDRLGSTRWMTRRRKAQEEIEKMADELLALYAEREMARAHACGGDSIWLNEFEASFLYEETPDQLKAIGEAKQDLEQTRPADRLVCGDVGFGKTEVAMRAAFKVVEEKKQVAILCPTTILADQHYRTFSERFADYPFKIEVLSRFKTAKEARETVKRVKAGEVDIVIGTHRLLSNDVKFNDLGLLIVDEEQRFGVRHKEKIKQMKHTVHVMTLTATPIPRTLYFAMSGLRDLSVIYTPPPNRLPIKTKIIHWDKPLIEEALLRELNRGGQVYFVHNRIHNIHEVVETLQEIVPRARIVSAHGRMKESELEQVIMDFVEGKCDVLVSTTIIENGIDIPNVNTILINRADSFGLAQLYQLRGRVGREAQQAYAYLLVPKGQAITDNAVKRLTAIEEFTELGAGFQIALRDMEIRGTGNILGKEQHGTIAAVGFDLYCNLLQEAVERMRGEVVEQRPKAEIRWKVNSFIPEEFIPMETQRVGVYKNLGKAETLAEVDDLADELKDRFGELPGPVENLLMLARLQVLARDLEIAEIQHGPAGIYFRFEGSLVELDKRWKASKDKLKIVRDLTVEEDGMVLAETKKELKPKGQLRLAVDLFKLLTTDKNPSSA